VASAVAAAIVTMLRANPFIDCSLDVDAMTLIRSAAGPYDRDHSAAGLRKTIADLVRRTIPSLSSAASVR
jgi:hypothetical protein